VIFSRFGDSSIFAKVSRICCLRSPAIFMFLTYSK
jgi:hypothetical protein